MRNIVFRFDDSSTFASALREGDQELVPPADERVTDGEWVLAIFEIGATRRATAAAARGLHRGAGAGHVVAFEERDWERLVEFAEAGERAMPASVPFPPEPPTQPSLPDVPSVRPPSASRPSFQHWRKSDPFAQGPNARVLLVDDDRDIREVVGAMLDAVGLTVEASTSARRKR